MRAQTRAVPILLALSLVGATGCQSVGGKFFGTLAVASAVGGGYLLVTSKEDVEHGMLVTHDDRREIGTGLVVVSVLAAAGWAFSELVRASHPAWYMGGGGGSIAPPPVAAEDAAEAVDEPEAEPATEPAPAGAGPPPVIVVRERRRPVRGWRFDRADNQDKLYGPRGDFIGRIDPAGDVWNGSGSHVGRVDTSSACGVACKRSQARKMLRGIPLSH
jgi:hypothetical protein